MERIAILVLSAGGLDLARRVVASLPSPARVYGPSCVVGSCGAGGPRPDRAPGDLPAGAFATDDPSVFGWTGPLRSFLPAVWERSDALVAVMSLGIVVRLVGPLAEDKRRDPAVVVVDEAGRFAIPALGGHGSGANDLARRLASTLGATPVITTASDAKGLPAVDLIGRDLGWKVERPENLTRVAAAVVRGKPIGIYQDAGPSDWWRPFGDWPSHFRRVASFEDLASFGAGANLVISDRLESAGLPGDRTVVYRPPSLVAGIGCRRGTPREVIAAWVEDVFARSGLAIGSLSALATVTLKADEPGLIAFAEGLGVPLLAYPPGRLEGVPGVERPSERVRSKIGIAAVAEPAALVGAGADRLVVPKQIGPGVTVAVARRPVSGGAHQP